MQLPTCKTEAQPFLLPCKWSAAPTETSVIYTALCAAVSTLSSPVLCEDQSWTPWPAAAGACTGPPQQLHAWPGHLSSFLHHPCCSVGAHFLSLPDLNILFQSHVFRNASLYYSSKHLQIIFPLQNLEINQQNSGFYLYVWNRQTAFLKVISGKAVLSQDTVLGFKSSFLSC